MFTAYDELQDIIDITKITKITLNEIELEKEATFELMKEITTEDIIATSIVFWTKNSRINIIVDHNYYGDEEIYFKETKLKQKTKIKVIPESLTQLWKDPETGMNLPLKTKAYLKDEKKKEEIRQKEIEKYKNEKYQKIKRIIEEKLNGAEEFEFEPFTIIEGGDYNRCRYITLPKNFPIPKSSYFLDNEEFYKNMETTKTYADFIGLAGIKDNKAQILLRYGSNSLNNIEDLKELVNKAIKENKFTPVLGISQEIIGGKDLDNTIQEIKKELENELNK